MKNGKNTHEHFEFTVLSSRSLLKVVMGAMHSEAFARIQIFVMFVLFGVGLLLIACEEVVLLHKSMVTLLLAASLWAVRCWLVGWLAILQGGGRRGGFKKFMNVFKSEIAQKRYLMCVLLVIVRLETKVPTKSISGARLIVHIKFEGRAVHCHDERSTLSGLNCGEESNGWI